MLHQAIGRVVARQEVWPGGYRFYINTPLAAIPVQPGQFVRLRPAGSEDPHLGRAYPLTGVGGETICVLTAETWPVGTELVLLGPLGRSFILNPKTAHLLLAGEGPDLSPLLLLAERAVAAGIAVVVAAWPDDRGRLCPAGLWPAEVEFRTTSVSQPFGRPLVDLLIWADQVCAAGQPAFYVNLYAEIRAHRLRSGPHFAQAYALERDQIACGIGACQCCVVHTRDGWRTTCHDGPVFPLGDLAGWELVGEPCVEQVAKPALHQPSPTGC